MLGLCPGVFDGVEVRTIGREIQEGVSGLDYDILDRSALMERGIVQNEDGAWARDLGRARPQKLLDSRSR